MEEEEHGNRFKGSCGQHRDDTWGGQSVMKIIMETKRGKRTKFSQQKLVQQQWKLNL